MAHRSFYAVRARRHEAAAKSAKDKRDREAHREVAAGYHKLARGSSKHTKSGLVYAYKKSHKKKHKKKKH